MRILWVMKKQLDVALDRTVRLEMMRSLAELGHDVTLATGYRYSQESFGLGSALRYLPSSRIPFVNHVLFAASLRRVLPRLVDELEPDAVILDAWTIHAATSWARHIRAGNGRTLVFADVRTLPVGSRGFKARIAETVFRRGIKRISAICDGLTTITDAMHEALVRDYGLAPDLCHGVWTSSVSATTFDPADHTYDDRADTRRELGIDENALLLIYHGAIILDRGLDVLVDALASAPPTVQLLIVGSGRDVAKLAGLVNSRGLSRRVHFVEAVPNREMPSLIAAADIGVLPLPDMPGWRVSSPIKLFEYLAMGTPVIVTPMRAHQDALGDCSCAFWAQGFSATDLAASAAMASETPLDVRREMGSRGRALVLERYTWEQQARKLVETLSACPRRTT